MLPSRLYASVPPDDPRFEDLRELLSAVKGKGKSSPAARMLGEWALLGFLLTTGRLTLTNGSTDLPRLSAELSDVAALLQAKRQLEQSATQLGDFDEG